MYFLEDLDEEEYEIAIKVCYFLVVSNDRLCDFNHVVFKKSTDRFVVCDAPFINCSYVRFQIFQVFLLEFRIRNDVNIVLN